MVFTTNMQRNFESIVNKAILLFLLLVALPSVAISQGEAPTVRIQEAQIAPVIKEVPLTGTVTSPQVAQVSSTVDGLVLKVHVDVGDRVNAGQVMIGLDRELEELALKAAQAATREAQASLADVQRRLKEAQALAAEQTVPQSEIDSLKSQVEINQAMLERYVAEEKQRQAEIRRHELKAPFSGVISKRFTEVGEWVEPGEAVVELIAIEKLRLDFQVPQRFYSAIDSQARLSVTMASEPNRVLASQIVTKVPVSDPTARTFLLRAHLVDNDIKITPGMSARASLQLDTDRQGVVVSRDALMRYPDGRVTVWVVNGQEPNLTVAERQVEVGVGFDGMVEIRSGLEAGSRVVTEGNEALQQGQTVREPSAN